MALGPTIAMPIAQPNVAAINTLTEFCVIFTLRGTHFERLSAQGLRTTLLEINQ